MSPRASLFAFFTLAASAALCASGCIPDANFDVRSLVKTPRILGMIADHPEIGPGESTTLSVVFADPLGGGRAVTYRWRMCVATESLGGGGAGLNGAQYGTMGTGPGCSDPTTSFDLGEGETTLVMAPPEASIDLLVEQFRAQVGDAISVEYIERLLTDVGIQLTVQVDIFTGAGPDEVLLTTGFKRVIVSRRADKGTNPPRPRFAVGDYGVVSAYAPGGSGLDCATESGEPIVVPPSTSIALRPDPTPQDPSDTATDEPWTLDATCSDADPVTECYGLLDPQGFFTQKPENAFYSWLITAGVLYEGTTLRPARDNEWTSPATPGDVTMWVITRDGHGGTAACRATITVR
jgi:hypothetical protein